MSDWARLLLLQSKGNETGNSKTFPVGDHHRRFLRQQPRALMLQRHDHDSWTPRPLSSMAESACNWQCAEQDATAMR